MILTITKFFLLVSLVSGCSLSQSESLQIEMYGTSGTPAASTGDRDPQYENWTLLNVTLTDSAGATTTTSYADAPEVFRIVDSPQIIFEGDMSDLVGTTFSSVVLEFESSLTGGDEKSSSLSATITNPTITVSESFTVKKARLQRILLKLKWGNTLSDSALEEPELEIELP